MSKPRVDGPSQRELRYRLHISRENLRRKILDEDDSPVEVGSLEVIERALSKITIPKETE